MITIYLQICSDIMNHVRTLQQWSIYLPLALYAFVFIYFTCIYAITPIIYYYNFFVFKSQQFSFAEVCLYLLLSLCLSLYAEVYLSLYICMCVSPPEKGIILFFEACVGGWVDLGLGFIATKVRLTLPLP